MFNKNDINFIYNQLLVYKDYSFYFYIYFSFSRKHIYCLRDRKLSCDLLKHKLPFNQLKQIQKSKYNVKFYRVLSVL